MSARVYTTSEVAAVLGVSAVTVRRYVATGQLPEPGWEKRGKKRQRAYTQEWVDQAVKWLQRS